MIPFFKKRKQRQAGQQVYDELTRKLDRLEEAVRLLSQRTPDYHITVEHLQIDRPVLESLIFRLDQLDIDEISGSFNLGNNFGVKMEPQQGRPEGRRTARQQPRRTAAAPGGTPRTARNGRPAPGGERTAGAPHAPKESQTASGLSFQFDRSL